MKRHYMMRAFLAALCQEQLRRERSASQPSRPDDGDRALEAIHRSFCSSGYGALAALKCELIDGVVTIRGMTPTVYQKQMAQELVLQVAEVRSINNLIDVRV